MSEVLERQREESRLTRGLAYDNMSRTYLDRYQQIAELEARQKVMRLDRDVEKYLRH